MQKSEIENFKSNFIKSGQKKKNTASAATAF